jgi:hypothetical protein
MTIIPGRGYICEDCNNHRNDRKDRQIRKDYVMSEGFIGG